MKVKITTDRYTRIFIDDEEIHRVVSYKLEESVDEKPRLTLVLAPEEIEVDTEIETLDKADKDKLDGYKEFIKFMFRAKER